MSRRTKYIRKRERQERRHVLRESAKKLIAAKIFTIGLIGDLARTPSSRAFDEALREAQHTEV
jgi:hypothetical protein